ncbi:MAG: NnrS family protein [Candidatus Omnitrophota bacterium]
MSKKFSNWWEAACREPYRIFFPLGVLAGTIGIGHWLFYAFHWLPKYSGFFHSSIQMMVYMNCFVAGFLMTAIPRFTGTPTAESREVLSFLLILGGMATFLSLEQWIVAEGMFIVWLVLLMAFVGKRIVARIRAGSSGQKPPLEMMWVPLGMMTGISATALLMLGQLEILPRWSLTIGKPMMDQGFLLCVVLGIGGFLIPRVMGTYAPLPSSGRLYATLFLVFIFTFILEGMQLFSWAYGLRAFVMTVVFIRARIISKLPVARSFYIRLVWISAWMTALGLWGAAFLPDYRIVWLHVTFIGGFSLMVYAIATMVIMSHAGEGERLQKPLWIFWMIGLGTVIVLIKRSFVAFFPDQYFQFLGMAAAVWLIVATSWFVFIIPSILKIPREDEFGKMHERAVREK